MLKTLPSISGQLDKRLLSQAGGSEGPEGGACLQREALKIAAHHAVGATDVYVKVIS